MVRCHIGPIKDADNMDKTWQAEWSDITLDQLRMQTTWTKRGKLNGQMLHWAN
jgi:hypothetical protein